MPTIAELEARNEILSRRLEETEQQLAKAEKLAGKLKAEVLQAQGNAEKAEKATIAARLRLVAHQAGSPEAAPGKPRGQIDDVVDDAMRTGTWKFDYAGRLVCEQPNGLDKSALAWMREHAKEKPFLFSTASGATSAASSSAQGTGVNPWSKKDWNQSEQNKYEIAHGKPAAEAMAAAAGSSIYAPHPPAE